MKKSILGFGLWSGLDCEIKGSGPIMSNFWGPFFHFFGDHSGRTEKLHWKKHSKKLLIIGPNPFIPRSSPQPTAQNWFFILWNLGTRHLFSYLCLQVFQEDCWTNGACLESVMTNQILAESTFACEDLCRQSPDCVWFTHYLDKGTVF